MKQLYGAVRLSLAVCVLLIAAITLLIAGLIPMQVQGASLAAWAVSLLARSILPLFRIRITCPAPERIRSHRGLIFPNHVSALDPPVLLSFGPKRFLGAAEIAPRPVIGWIAAKLGTIFVSRQDKQSRLAARQQVADAYRAADRPPIVLFPEGRLGPGDGVFPFRRGGFEIAQDHGIPYLTCALRYDPVDIALWRAARQREEMWGNLWRIAQYTGVVRVDVIPLSYVEPRPGDSPQELADTARQEIADALAVPFLTPADVGARP